MYYLIYKITNVENGKIYIGKHMTDNKDDGYMGSGKYLLAAQNYHGLDKFKKEILFEFDNEEDMNKKEKELVNEEFIAREDTYNLTIGGAGSWFGANAAFTSDRRSAKMKQYYKDHPEQRKGRGDKISRYFKSIKGTKKYENLIEKYRKAKLKWCKENPNAFVGSRNGFYGMHHTNEAKQKIRNGHIGEKNSMYGMQWVVNYETKENIRIAKGSPIPNGFVLGRCMNFDKQETSIAKVAQAMKVSQIPNPNDLKFPDFDFSEDSFNRIKTKLLLFGKKVSKQEAKEFYTNVVKDYNKYGFECVRKKYNLEMSKTTFFRNCRRYSSVRIDTSNMSGRLATNHKMNSFTKQLRTMTAEQKTELYRKMYTVFLEGGYEEVVKQFQYPNTRYGLLWSFKKFVPEYIPKECPRWKNRIDIG